VTLSKETGWNKNSNDGNGNELNGKYELALCKQSNCIEGAEDEYWLGLFNKETNDQIDLETVNKEQIQAIINSLNGLINADFKPVNT
jgi:uncharacterized Fe-S cluster protein YjdI